MKESTVNTINKKILESGKSKPYRNFEFFFASEEKDTTVTYKLDKKKIWGMSPEFSEINMQKWINKEKSPLDSKEALDKEYEKFSKKKLWTMDFSKEEIAKFYKPEEISKALFKRSLLAFSQHWFFYYKIEEKEAEHILKNVWKQNLPKDDYFDFVDINENLKNLNERKGTKIKDSKKIIIRKINGRLPVSVIEKLKKANMGFDFSKCDIDGKTINTIRIFKKAEKDKSIQNLYKSKKIKSCMYCVSPELYSGVIARLDKVKKEEKKNSCNYCMYLSLITYLTHLGFKDPRMNYTSEFFDDKEKKVLKKADEIECMLQKKMYMDANMALKKNTYNEKSIDILNEYLEKTISPHGMNVSCNIILENNDGNEVVFTKRGKDTFDSSSLYCSANGVCEVDDSRVKHYENTDFIKPSIGENNILKGNFLKEMSRETESELNLKTKNYKWNTYGFVIMGYYNPNNTKHSFPMNLNVLGYTQINKTLADLRENSKNAWEGYENEKIYSFSIKPESQENKENDGVKIINCNNLHELSSFVDEKYPNAHIILVTMLYLYYMVNCEKK